MPSDFPSSPLPSPLSSPQASPLVSPLFGRLALARVILDAFSANRQRRTRRLTAVRARRQRALRLLMATGLLAGIAAAWMMVA